MPLEAVPMIDIAPYRTGAEARKRVVATPNVWPRTEAMDCRYGATALAAGKHPPCTLSGIDPGAVLARLKVYIPKHVVRPARQASCS